MNYNMSDLDKIIGAEPVSLSDVQKNLLNIYTDCRKKFRLLEQVDHDLDNKLLNHLNDFYKSLDDNQKKITYSWLNYEICNIDKFLVTSVKISEFATQNNLKDKLSISKDNNFFVFTVDSAEQAILIQKSFSKKYINVECNIS